MNCNAWRYQLSFWILWVETWLASRVTLPRLTLLLSAPSSSWTPIGVSCLFFSPLATLPVKNFSAVFRPLNWRVTTSCSLPELHFTWMNLSLTRSLSVQRLLIRHEVSSFYSNAVQFLNLIWYRDWFSLTAGLMVVLATRRRAGLCSRSHWNTLSFP